MDTCTFIFEFCFTIESLYKQHYTYHFWKRPIRPNSQNFVYLEVDDGFHYHLTLVFVIGGVEKNSETEMFLMYLLLNEEAYFILLQYNQPLEGLEYDLHPEAALPNFVSIARCLQEQSVVNSDACQHIQLADYNL